MENPTKIEDLIQQKKQKLSELKQKKRDEDLIHLGLFEKEYSDSQTNEYIDSEYYRETAMLKYYKKVPLKDVSDKQIDELLSLTKEIEHLEKEIKEVKGTLAPNTVAFTLKLIGIVVYIVGGITAMFFLGNGGPQVGLITIFSAFVSGTLFIGFSEIIKLLHSINDKQK
jgi:hypothetical protein